MRYAKVSHVLYQSCFISDMLNINNSKNQKQLMPIIPNINKCKCQSFCRSEMSTFKNVKLVDTTKANHPPDSAERKVLQNSNNSKHQTENEIDYNVVIQEDKNGMKILTKIGLIAS